MSDKSAIKIIEESTIAGFLLPFLPFIVMNGGITQPLPVNMLLIGFGCIGVVPSTLIGTAIGCGLSITNLL